MPDQTAQQDLQIALETIIANDSLSAEKLQENNLLNQKQIQLLQEISASNENLGGLLDIVIQIINRNPKTEEERENVSLEKTNKLLEDLLAESKKPWNTTVTLELE